MDTIGSFRFLIIASALLLWVGAVATAGEPAETEEGQTPPIEASPPAAPGDDAADEAEEAPSEESEETSES